MKKRDFFRAKEMLKRKEEFLRKKEEQLFDRYRKKRRAILAISVLMIVILYAFKNYSNLFRALSAIVFLLAFYVADHLFRVDFKERHYIFITLMAIFGLLLSKFYFLFSFYDKVQHMLFPMMLGSICYHMVSGLKLERKWKLVFVFFVVVGSVGMFEIGEYGLDNFFDWKLQGVFIQEIQEGLEEYKLFLDRIDDTMVDMAFGVLGAALYVFGIVLFDRKRRVIRIPKSA